LRVNVRALRRQRKRRAPRLHSAGPDGFPGLLMWRLIGGRA
jgi:hypothetical protein